MEIKIEKVKLVAYISQSGIVEVYVYLHGKKIFERCFTSIHDVSYPEILNELGIEL
jgi:hypothetical protein